MESTLLSGDWAAFTSSLPRTGGLAVLGMLVALALAFVLTALFPPAEVPAVAGSQSIPAPVDRTWATEAGAAPVPVAASPRPATLQGTALLRGAELSPTDVIALASLRRRIQAGEVADGPTGPERLEFARWLIEHGRLEG